MRLHSFTALVMLDPAAADAARCDFDGTRDGCLLEHGCYTYFPAVISLGNARPAPSATPALVSIALGDGEARAVFAPGQRFTIWTDAVVGDTIQASGLVGHGVISQPVPPPWPRVPRDEAAASPGCLARAAMPGGSSAARSVIAVSTGCEVSRIRSENQDTIPNGRG